MLTWALATSNATPTTWLKDLVTIAEGFGQVDQVMFDEIRDDLVRFEQPNREGNSRFKDSVDAQIRSFVNKATTGDGDIEPLRTDIVTSIWRTRRVSRPGLWSLGLCLS